MNATGTLLQQKIQHASDSKSATPELTAFAEPPPLSRQSSNAKCSYTSLVAMVSQSECLLPPPNVVTPSFVCETEINDTEVVSDRSISAQDVVSAIEELWELSQLPSVVIDEDR